MSQSQRPTASSISGTVVGEAATSQLPPTSGSEPLVTSASAPVKRKPGRPRADPTSMSAPPEGNPQAGTTSPPKSSGTVMVLRERAPMVRAATQGPKEEGGSEGATNSRLLWFQKKIAQGPCQRCDTEGIECVLGEAYACERCSSKKQSCSYILPHSRSASRRADLKGGELDAGDPANETPPVPEEKEWENLREAKQQWFKSELAKGPCGRCATEKAECITTKGVYTFRCQRCIKRKTRCSYLLPNSIMALYKTPPEADGSDEEEDTPSETPSAPPPPSAELQEAQIKIIELQALLAEAKADRDAALRRAAELEHQVGCKDAVIRKMEGEKKAEADSKRRGLKRAEDLYLTEKEAKERLAEEVEKLTKEVEKLRAATELSDSEKETRDKEFAELKEKFEVADGLVTDLQEDLDENMLSLQVPIDDEVYKLRRIAGTLKDSEEGHRIQGSVQKLERVVEACKARRLLGSSIDQKPFFAKKRELEEYRGEVLEVDGDGRRSKVQRVS
ncbi:hypothetical protein K443DRAFT_197282 [Laccaria amethystina LaAM-08-1]|uniref:Zn(2)-C6 fungal-type domain-containing protein n=1 Tax=Laccaria amethystina LaAM-08-1 TaxID=1095629 RepID=A0A0C9XRX4_9AGAR|nr:hypothetical protein K443DRAFT_197282 [Laccaria amethystina LaAM-08-1]